jgi:hypothetical protein
MIVRGRIVLLLFALFSFGIIFCQNTKQNQPPSFRICFGKFLPDSTYIAKTNEVILADSLFVKGGAGRITSFDVYTNSDSVGITESIYGNRLSKKQKLLISKLKPGQMVFIQKIIVKYTGKEKTKSSSRFIFKIRS